MRCPSLNDLPPPPPGKTGWPWTEACPQLPDIRPDGLPWPRVSIVTPSYNQGQFIEETIRSILLQGYPDLEYIIMDGGSTDETLNILRKYKIWFSHLQSHPDDGQSSAIAAGFNRSTGTALNWINSDDGLLPFALYRVGTHIEKNMVLIGNSIYKNDKEAHYVQTTMFPRFFKVIGGAIPQHSTFWHRSIHLDPKPEIQCAMDFDLWLRMISISVKVRRIDLAISYVNMHPGQKQADIKFQAAWQSDQSSIAKNSSYFRRLRPFLPIFQRIFAYAKKIQDAVSRPRDTNRIAAVFPSLRFKFHCKMARLP